MNDPRHEKCPHCGWTPEEQDELANLAQSAEELHRQLLIARSEIDRCVAVEQEKGRALFSEFERVNEERMKYQKALQTLCEHGRCPIAEEALGL